MKRLIVTITSMIFGLSAATAGFDSWTVETESDPFAGAQIVTASYNSSARNGVFIECNSETGTVILKAIAGWAYIPDLALVTPEVQYAVDGNVIAISGVAETGAFGDNVAGVSVRFDADQARKLVEAFSSAKKQIAVKDGISDRPLLLKARGSTAVGKKLLGCIDKFKPSLPEVKIDTPSVPTDEPKVVATPTVSSKVDNDGSSLKDFQTPEGVGFAQTAWAACLTTHDYASAQITATVNATAAKHISHSFPRFQAGQEEFNVVAAQDIEKACNLAVEKGALTPR
jgi:hypothetical protein